MNELTGSAPTQVLCRHSGRCCFSRAAFQKSDQVVIPLKNPIQPKTLPVFSLCLGLVGLVLQIILLSTGLDGKGLLITGSLPEICSWILTGCSLLILLLGIRDLGGIPRGSRLFPASPLAAIGTCVGGAGIAHAAIRSLLSSGSFVYLISAIAGFASVLCLAALAYCRWKGQAITLFVRMPIILFFTMYSLCEYRIWTASTQLMEYAFPMLAIVFLLLTSYHRAALEVRMNGRRSYVFCNLAALYFSLLAVPHNPIFYLAMAVWMLSDTCSLQQLVRRPRPAVQEPQSEE